MAFFRDTAPAAKVLRPATYMTSPGMYTQPVKNAYADYQRTSQPKPPAAAKPRAATQPTQPTAPAAAPAPAAPAAPAANPYDYSSDPVLQAIRAGGIRSRANAESAALASRKQLAIQLGDAAGIVDDAGTAQAAKGNSFSTLAEIMRGYGRAVDTTDENLNQANLFYSGYRGEQLARLLEDRQRQEYGARGSAQQQLTDINQTLASELERIALQDAQAEADAKERALQQALMYGVDPGQGQPQENPYAGTTGPAPTPGNVEDQVLQSIAGVAAPTQQIDPWLLAAMAGRRP